MKTHKILVPTDFSESAKAAFQYAQSLAKESGKALLIVHVEAPPVVYGGDEMYSGVYEVDDSLIRQMLERVRPSSEDIEYEHRYLSGDPAEKILALADKEKVDLIVMGSHGRSGLVRVLMGSVAETVVRQATCPVLTVKHPQPEPTEKARIA